MRLSKCFLKFSECEFWQIPYVKGFILKRVRFLKEYVGFGQEGRFYLVFFEALAWRVLQFSLRKRGEFAFSILRNSISKSAGFARRDAKRDSKMGGKR